MDLYYTFILCLTVQLTLKSEYIGYFSNIIEQDFFAIILQKTVEMSI